MSTLHSSMELLESFWRTQAAANQTVKYAGSCANLKFLHASSIYHRLRARFPAALVVRVRQRSL